MNIKRQRNVCIASPVEMRWFPEEFGQLMIYLDATLKMQVLSVIDFSAMCFLWLTTPLSEHENDTNMYPYFPFGFFWK